MDKASEDIKKSSRGRPKADSTPIMVRVGAAELTALDNWRRAQPDLPTRPEAIRRLVERGLDAE